MYSRGKFGIEYTPTEPKPEGSWLGRLLLVVALVVVVLVARSFWTRLRSRLAAGQTVEIRTDEDRAAPPRQATADVSATNAPAGLRPPSVERRKSGAAFLEVDYANRPVKVRNLLLRLQAAEERKDVEMAVSTIEQLRNTPGIADLDDTLARRLGKLNHQRLFGLKSAQWTTVTIVKRGDSATRIAYEHGSTLASLVKLNGGKLDKLKIGQKLTVMNHPRFNLIISRRTRTADLMLNGKFFKRYYLPGEVKGAAGSYETPDRFRNFCTEKGVPFKSSDRDELEMLLPMGTAAFIKEI